VVQTSPSPTRGIARELIALALPLSVAGAAIAANDFVGRWILSTLGPVTLAATAPAALFAQWLGVFFLAAAGYLASVVARRVGARDERGAGPALWPGLALAAIGGALAIAAIPLLPLVAAAATRDAAVAELIPRFGRWLLMAVGPGIALAAFNGLFIGIGRGGVVLALDGAACVINAGLAWFLVRAETGPHLGVDGAGIAAVASTSGAVLVAAALAWTPRMRARYGTWDGRSGIVRRLRLFISEAGAQGLSSVVSVAAWGWFFLVVGRFGREPMAATNALMAWTVVAYVPMIAVGRAVTVAVGRATGAGDPGRARRIARTGCALAGMCAVVVGVAFVAGREALVGAFVPAGSEGGERIIALGRQLMWVVAAWGIADAVVIAYAGALAGIGDVRWMCVAAPCCLGTLLVVPCLAILAAPDAWWGRLGAEPVVVLWFVSVANEIGWGWLLHRRFAAVTARHATPRRGTDDAPAATAA